MIMHALSQTDQLHDPLKVRFAQSEFNILCVLHKLSERKKKETSVIQANSNSKVTF